MALFSMVVSQFNGTSTPKGSYSAKTGDNDCNVNSSCYSLRTAVWEHGCSDRKSEQNVRQDLIPRVRHGEAALMHPYLASTIKLLRQGMKLWLRGPCCQVARRIFKAGFYPTSSRNNGDIGEAGTQCYYYWTGWSWENDSVETDG